MSDQTPPPPPPPRRRRVRRRRSDGLANAPTIARIAGVEIRVHASWLIIAALIGWTFYLRVDAVYADLGVASTVGLAAAGAVLFFGSVLLHELSHSLLAKARGLEVRGITLFLFGGATDADVHARGAGTEFAVAAIGPITSAAIGGVLWGASAAVGGQSEAVAGMLAYLAWVNVALAVFNLLPGFPLDGGRILRSATWGITGSLERATRIAATAGRFIGYAMIALGIVSFLIGAPGGLWFALIGWFLSRAATAEADEQRRQEHREQQQAGAAESGPHQEAA